LVGRRHTERFGRLRGSDDGGPFARDGKGPCFVAFHGFTGTTSEIRPLLDAVATRGFAVHAPLLPGHGTSPHRLQEQTFDDWTSAMQSELDGVFAKHERVVLCGFSLGSLVAMELAARAPKGLVGLVLLGNALTLNAGLDTALGFAHRKNWKLPDWYFLKLWPADLRDRSQREKVTAYDRDPLRAALEVYRAGVRVKDRLASISVPTLILHGGRDRVCPQTNVERVKSAIGAKDVRSRIFPESAHMLAADLERDDVAREVVAFIEEQAKA
jgi:carboxylesterase